VRKSSGSTDAQVIGHLADLLAAWIDAKIAPVG
jgi:hypothetical protein